MNLDTVSLVKEKRKYSSRFSHTIVTILPKMLAAVLKKLFNDENHEYSRAVKFCSTIIFHYKKKDISFNQPYPIPSAYVKRILTGKGHSVWKSILKNRVLIKKRNHSNAYHVCSAYVFNPKYQFDTPEIVEYLETSSKSSDEFSNQVIDTLSRIQLKATKIDDIIDFDYLKEQVSKNISGKKYKRSNGKPTVITGDIEKFIISKAREYKFFDQCALLKIQKGIWLANRNKTNYRLDTNLTQLRSKYRNHLHVDGKPLHSIDLKNSQFVIFANIINLCKDRKTDEKFNTGDIEGLFLDEFKVINYLYHIMFPTNIERDEINSFCAYCIDGSIYTEIAKVIGAYDQFGYPDRNQGKALAFKLFFSIPKDSKEIKKLKSVFPNVIKLIDEFKYHYIDLENADYEADQKNYLSYFRDKKRMRRGYYENLNAFIIRKGSSRFSVFLQKVESYIFIDAIYKDLFRDYILYSIHDSFLYTDDKTKHEIIDRLNFYLPYGYKVHSD